MDIVSLSIQDDEALFMAASGLANIADALDSGEEITDLSQLLRLASMIIANVMAEAHDRSNFSEVSQN
jgi:hypothetical protein